MNLIELQHFLDSNTIPKIKKKPKTFLGIAKQPHYENVLSNIYAFFFNVNEEHGLKDLFLKSLVELIGDSEKIEKDFSDFTNFDIETEYYTDGLGKSKKTGRIDLLLYNDNSAIIIENKVHHYLNNDLDDYWRSVKLDTDNVESKIGILLSLKPISENEYKKFDHSHEYINITHLQFLKKVMDNLGDYYVGANEKYLIYLKDLCQNIINMSNHMEKDMLSFYYKNIEELNNIAKIKFTVRDYVKQEVENTCQVLGKGLVLNKSRADLEKRLRYYVSSVNPNLMITIVFDELLTPVRKIWIIIDLKYQTLENKDIYKDLTDCKDYVNIIDKTFMSNTNKVWAHIAVKDYVLTDNQIEDVGEFIETTLEKGKFLSLFDKLEKIVNL